MQVAYNAVLATFRTLINVTSTVIIQAKRGIGDVIWHLPFIRAIAAATPEGAVTFLTPPSSMGAELLQAENCVARTSYFEHGGSEVARAFQLARLTQMLVELRPRTAWILDKTIRPALAACLARVPQRIGMGIRAQRFLITNPGLDPSYDEVYPIECLIAVLKQVGVPLETTEPNLNLPAPVVAAIGQRFQAHPRPWTVVGVGASNSREGLVARAMDCVPGASTAAYAGNDLPDRRAGERFLRGGSHRKDIGREHDQCM